MHASIVLRSAVLVAASSVMPLPALAHGTPERGRLVFADHEKAVVRILDLDTGAVTHEMAVPKANPVLTSASNGRLVVIKTGTEEEEVRFLDTGVTIEPHGDHNDLSKGAVQILPFALKGDRPAHVLSGHGWVSVFFDGLRPWEGPSKPRAIFVESASLLKGMPKLLEWRSPGPQHGIAFALSPDQFLISEPNPAYVKGDDRSASSRPNRFDVFMADAKGAAWSVSTRLADGCRLYHGHAVLDGLHAFGCAESGEDAGLLTLRRDGNSWKTGRLAYPDGRRTSTIKTAAGARFMVGNYGSTSPYHAFIRIDPATAKLEAGDVMPVPGGQATCHFAVEPTANRLANLTPDGKLRIYDIATWKELVAFDSVPAFDCAFGAKTATPTLAISGKSVFVSDPLHGRIREYHVDTLRQGLDHSTGGRPANLAAAE